MHDNYSDHREQRNQALEDRYGVKIENRAPPHQVIDHLAQPLFDRTAISHRNSVQQRGNAGPPNNAADLGFDRRGRDAYDHDHMTKSPGMWKTVKEFSNKFFRSDDD
jgi:hypothetical protein